MSAPSPTTRKKLLAWIVAIALAPACALRADEADETLLWTPALSVSFDVLGQKARGAVTNGPVIGPPLPEGCDGMGGQLCPRSDFDQARDTQIRPDDSGSDTLAAPLVGVSLELMTPRLFEAAWKPRLFARGDVAVSFGFERNLAGEAEPGPFGRPPFLQPNTRIPESTVTGQGSRAVAQLERYTFSGGVGVAFTRSWLGRTWRVRTSFEYLRERLELKGAVHRAVALTRSTFTLDEFRLIVLDAERTETYHGFGGGLEIEADTLRLGPIRSSVFLGGRLVRFTGSLETTLRATNQSGETSTWTFENEPWSWRGNAGIRFRWVPSDL